MPTVSSTIRQTEMLGQLSYRLFRLDMVAADNSILVGGTIETNSNLIQSDFGGQPALTTMVENYTKEKSAFRSEFKDAMNNLQNSAEHLKNSVQSEGESSQEISSAEESEETESNVSAQKETAKNTVVAQERKIFTRAHANSEKTQNRPEQIRQNLKAEDNFQKFAQNYLVAENDEDGQENSTLQDENQNDKLSSVQSFVRDYNKTVSYLNDSNIPSPLSSLNQNDELTLSLNEIGISADSSGVLSIDEKTLSGALQNDPEKVSSALGNDGLIGQLDKDFDRFNRRSENLFPTIVDYANQHETNLSESLYSAKNSATATYYGVHAGNLLNAFT